MTAANSEAVGGPGGEESPAVRWTLSLLPTVVGLVGIGVLIAGAVLSGMTDARFGWSFTAVAAVAVAVTVGAGPNYGLYLGLTIVAIGGMVANGGPTTAQLGALGATLVVVHEIVRFSLDARMPTRFGPGLAIGYGITTVGVALIAVGLAYAIDEFFEQAPTGTLWIPLAVVAAAVPLFVVVAAERSRAYRFFDRPTVRAVAAVAAVAAATAIVVVGAQARGALVSDGPEQISTRRATPTTTQPIETAGAAAGEPISRLAIGITILVIGLVLYAMLRKPEADYQLEEIEQPTESRQFDLGIAGTADSEADTAAIDEADLARLLADLQLDLAAEPDPGRAIRFGYAKIEHHLAELGVTRAEAETEREFLSRALPTLGSAGPSMATLTNLFEAARFGHEPVGEPMRQRALDAIGTLMAASRAGDGR